jgi:hypothetical protein
MESIREFPGPARIDVRNLDPLTAKEKQHMVSMKLT